MTVHDWHSRGTSENNGLQRALNIVLAAWGVAAILSLIIGLIVAKWLGILFFLTASGYAAFHAFGLFSLRSRVLQEKDILLWKGLARMVAWNPTEGVLFLKNKQVDFVDDNPNDGGGIRCIFPIMGEELATRVPLEIQTTPFSDDGILTKEFIPVSMKATIFWKISDLYKFSISLSKEVHSVNDRGGHSIEPKDSNPQLGTAERWLSSLMEEKTRATVSRVGTGLLISDRLMNELPMALPGEGQPQNALMGPSSSEIYRSATEGLASAVTGTLADAVADYGIEVHRVTLQQINLPPEIYAAAVEACKSAYTPLKARADAMAEKMRLQARADVIGAEATGLKEIAGNVPALVLQDFLGPLFLKMARRGSEPV